MRQLLLLLACALVVPIAGATTAEAAVPWPASTLQLGLDDEEGGAAALRASAPFGLRYHYLAGGVNTPQPWQTWATGGGSFVPGFIADSAANGMIPVFSYYQLRQSLPGAGQPDEPAAVLGNLRDRRTMRAWFEDLKVFFQKAEETGQTTVLQVEPDLWGYVQAYGGDDAADTPAQVAATRMPDLRALPDTAAGVARGVERLRDAYGPHVLLGYPVSIWGTGKDIAISDESDEAIDALAARSVRFYRSLRTDFDVIFTEVADRDSAYAATRDGRGDSAWWDAADFARHARFVGDVHAALRRPVVVWQIPLGNTLYRAMDNTPHHWQDNRVQWFLGPDSREHLRTYLRAGVVALLFGAGQADGTCACDAAGDGVTNPMPIGANTRPSLSADDDGGYFRARAAAYYAEGAMPRPARTRAPRRHAGHALPAKPRRPGRFHTSARVSKRVVRRGRTVTIAARVRV
ncbi:MAG TPA: hypothetical protein VFR97_03410, partial [Capillimicrobium sp.]|nr:hypothetical protein [Capillimicrobium sp.]